MTKEFELRYDYYKNKNFVSGMNLEPFDGGVAYECSGGEGTMYCKEINDLIPEHLRNEDGSYELGHIADAEMQKALIEAFKAYKIKRK
jgi:hypothetical protein